MLTKAILTGGFLSVLAGSIVYFGAEGADALERDVHQEARLDATELAGAAEPELKAFDIEVETADVDVETLDAGKTQKTTIDPPTTKHKPKKKWLDQYLKSKPSDAEGKATAAETSGDVEAGVEIEVESEVSQDASPRKIKKIGGGKQVVTTTEENTIHVDEDFDINMIEELLAQHKDSKAKVQIIKIDDREHKGIKSNKVKGKPAKPFAYEAVLTEARKLQVIDMRNEAVLEVIDFAIDRNDVGDAADIVGELSSPELRDTARARIAVGLAKSGKMDPAFAVLEEIEIDELTAPIRLEIITALMATRAEREALRKAK